MEKEAGNKKIKKNPSQPMPEELKPKAIKWKRKLQIKKPKKKTSQPKPDGLKPKVIKWEKKPQIKKKKIDHCLNPTDLNQGQ